MKDKLRELAERWKRIANADRRDYGEVQANRIECFADELLAILDIELDDVPEIFQGTKCQLNNLSIKLDDSRGRCD